VADLAVVKTTPVPAVRLGQVVPYTVTLTNNGPDAATNVAVTDIIPAGLSFLSRRPARAPTTQQARSGA